MKSITESIQEIIIKEDAKSSADKKFKEFEQLLEQLKQLGVAKEPEYSLPLVDTIGRTFYSTINKHLNI